MRGHYFSSSKLLKQISASNGWLDCFCKRNNIIFNVLCGESSGVDTQVAQDWKRKLPDITSGFAAEDIFNASYQNICWLKKVKFVKEGQDQNKELQFCFVVVHVEKTKTACYWKCCQSKSIQKKQCGRKWPSCNVASQ